MGATRIQTEAKAGRIAFASILGVVSQLVSLGLALWVTPYLVHGLGDAVYSLLGIIGSFTSYFAYLELGIGAAYVRTLAISLALGQTERAQRLVETAHAIYTRIALLGALGMLGLGIPYLVGVVAAPSQRAEIFGALIATALAFVASMWLSASRAVVFSSQRTDLYAWVSLAVQPLIPIAQVIAVRRGGQLIAVMAIQAVGSTSIDLMVMCIARRLHPELRLRQRFHPEVWNELRSFSLYRFVTQLAQQAQINGDRVLLGGMMPTTALAPYSIAASLAQRVRNAGIVICAPFFAAASEQFAQRGAVGLADITSSFGRRLGVLLAVGTAAASFLGRPFLAAWIGARYANEGAPLLNMLVLAVSLFVLGTLFSQAIDVAGVPRASAMATVIGLLLSLGASLPLVRWLGPLGAAYGFLAGAAAQLALLVWALRPLIGAQAVASMLTVTIAAPAAVGVAARLTMQFAMRGATLTAALAPLSVGLAVGFVVAVVTRALQPQDLPARLRRAFGWTR